MKHPPAEEAVETVSGSGPARRYTLVITCPRPRSRGRAGNDFHVQPQRVERTVAAFIGDDAEVTLTRRTVRLRVTTRHPIRDVTVWHSRMALIMDGLWLDVPRVRGELQLPSPARTQIEETDSSRS
ncbi:hypothetical protein AB0M58_13695 [Streptomyces bobili]|uniref:hypothetical protein n=1 Tax=Streptomyces bobili TaxID=67280 RepID=UPI0034269114